MEGNSAEPGNVVSLGNNVTQLTRGNVVLHNVPHNVENIPIGHECSNFVVSRGLAEAFTHSQGNVEENRNNLGQGSDEFFNLPERQSNSSNANANNIAQNDHNTSETEIVDSLQEDHYLNNINYVTALADADDDNDCDDIDYDNDPISSETDDELLMMAIVTLILMTVIFKF